jgi:hypothetical protein
MTPKAQTTTKAKINSRIASNSKTSVHSAKETISGVTRQSIE